MTLDSGQATIWIPTEDGVDAFEDVDVKGTSQKRSFSHKSGLQPDCLCPFEVEVLGAGKDEDGNAETTYRLQAEFTGDSASDGLDILPGKSHISCPPSLWHAILTPPPVSTDVTWVQGASHGRVDQIVETTMSDEYYGEAYQSIHYIQDCDGKAGGPVTCVNGGMQRISAANEAVDTTIAHPDMTTTISAQAITTIAAGAEAAEDEDSGAAGLNAASSMVVVMAAGLGYLAL